MLYANLFFIQRSAKVGNNLTLEKKENEYYQNFQNTVLLNHSGNQLKQNFTLMFFHKNLKKLVRKLLKSIER